MVRGNQAEGLSEQETADRARLRKSSEGYALGKITAATVEKYQADRPDLGIQITKKP